MRISSREGARAPAKSATLNLPVEASGTTLHPFHAFEVDIKKHLPSDIVLEIGCGPDAELLGSLAHTARVTIGLDVGDFHPPVRYVRADAAQSGLRDNSVDLIISRSVLEHLRHPLEMFREAHRILRPGGCFVFLTPNRWGYSSIAARVVPNRLHPWLVRRLTGREEQDTVPTRYRANTIRTIRRLAEESGFTVEALNYISHWPHYLKRVPVLRQVEVAYLSLVCANISWLRGCILGTLVAEKEVCGSNPSARLDASELAHHWM